MHRDLFNLYCSWSIIMFLAFLLTFEHVCIEWVNHYTDYLLLSERVAKGGNDFERADCPRSGSHAAHIPFIHHINLTGFV